MNPSHVPTVITFPLGGLTADTPSKLVGYLARKSRIISVHLVNGAAIAASDTDYVQLMLKNSAGEVVAEIDSRAAHENGIASKTGEALNIVEAKQDVKGILDLDYEETGTVGLTDAILVINAVPIETV